MKASELMEKLSELINNHGDCEVRIYAHDTLEKDGSHKDRGCEVADVGVISDLDSKEFALCDEMAAENFASMAGDGE